MKPVLKPSSSRRRTRSRRRAARPPRRPRPPDSPSPGTEQSVPLILRRAVAVSSRPFVFMSAKTGTISLAETPEAIARCHAVMRELRPQFDDEARFVARIMQQISEGYHLAYMESEG